MANLAINHIQERTAFSPADLHAAHQEAESAWDELKVAENIQRFVLGNRRFLPPEVWHEEAEAAREGLEQKQRAWHQAMQCYEEIWKEVRH